MITLFNTATSRLEPVTFLANRASVYVCGVTPYDTTHLGHAFTYLAYDVLIRFLRHSGVKVTYAQNVTDIDDDILRKSKELGIAYSELASRETAQFLADMDSLNVIRPDRFVQATQVIPEIVTSVERLVNRGAAYISDGNVYFDSTSFPDYGAISHSGRDSQIKLAAEHGGFPDDSRKRDPLDFLLWQKHIAGEPEWPSPFGPGRPGWHIECSTIATEVLGLPVSIHGGGVDLVFPHHASEIAQAETLTGVHPFVQHWMHTAMVRMDGEKMSKSLGNMVFVRDLIKRYSADAIRLYLLSHHYRQEFEWEEAELADAADLASRLTTLDLQHVAGEPTSDGSIVDAMNESTGDDLQTPEVVRRLAALAEGGNRDVPATGVAAALSWAVDVLGLQLSRSGTPAESLSP